MKEIRRILWVSNAPWDGTAYAEQTALWVPGLAGLGYEMAIMAFHGLRGSPREWNGFTVYAGTDSAPYGGDILGSHARHFGADLIISLMDQWACEVDPASLPCPMACWMPVDCEPLSLRDHTKLMETRAIPIAVSRFGEAQLRDAGFDPLYVPHGLDTTKVFRPPEDRDALRKAMGVQGKFVVLIVAANNKSYRKAWFEQFYAFARLLKRHDDAILVVHTQRHPAYGNDLATLADRLGISPAVRWSDQYLTTAGLVTPRMMAGTYGMSHLISGCTQAEGFGMTPLEGMACGTPAVVTKGSASDEVGGPAWKVRGQPAYAWGHESQWTTPFIDDIYRVYEKAYERGAAYQAKAAAARPHALTYDVDLVLEKFWVPALEAIQARI